MSLSFNLKQKFLTIKDASSWASNYLQKSISTSNISYLIQYGKVKKYNNKNTTFIHQEDLLNYYQNLNNNQKVIWEEKLGKDFNHFLSFQHLREKETTKHVHRLHPYKGKFIPQLVEYFIDEHTDQFKTQAYFQKGDILLDPFCGSGTTLVQANELGMHAIGVDVSNFNALLSNVKIGNAPLEILQIEIKKITNALQNFLSKTNHLQFEKELLAELTCFNKKYFPAPEFRRKVYQKKIDEKQYTLPKEQEFLKCFQQLQKKYKIPFHNHCTDNFLEKWYLESIKKEIDFVFGEIKKINNQEVKKIITLILSRTMRSCRATTHADLATLKEPISTTYYCQKHGKICKPLFSIFSWWVRYSKDTTIRLAEFQYFKTNTKQYCLHSDSRDINLLARLEKKDKIFAELVRKQKIKGIFSSPPYVGLIDYHQQHAYAYDLFGFKRKDELEIGPLYKGQGLQARKSYMESIIQVLINSKKYLQNNYNIFLVANDKYNMYPNIAEKSGMKIINQYKRPVLNRTERDKSTYAEIIFHFKEK